MLARAIAFYLPQYHPIPENDEWWGKGFTEWTNVTRAKPLYKGHRQPNLPADLGFYDLRLPEVREQQAALARAAGIEGFCYWHYWFGNGKKILERPINEVIQTGKPDFPFCLCWANASWSGIWYGAPNRILLEQQYLGEKDYEAFFYDTLPALRDPRYIRIEGRPLFIIYHPSKIPDWTVFAATWRRLAEQEGLGGIYLLGFESKRREGLDGHAINLPAGFLENGYRGGNPIRQLQRSLHRTRRFVRMRWLGHPKIQSYEEFIGHIPDTPLPLEEHATVLPNWDNTPRSGQRGTVYEGATPGLFARQLRKAICRVAHKPPEHRLVLIKAWNEWAEGNYLEPDRTFGHGWLEACRGELAPLSLHSGQEGTGAPTGQGAPV